mgnify:CR=1 FL=1
MDDENNHVEATPEKIAESIFNASPAPPNTYQILAQDDDADLYYVYELLLTIMLEGFNILTGGLENVDPNDINKDHFVGLNQWFRSIGFDILIDEVQKENSDDYDNYYCKVIMRNSSYGFIFESKNLEKDYHFLTNANHENSEEEIKDIFAIFVANDNIYKVSFEFC